MKKLNIVIYIILIAVLSLFTACRNNNNSISENLSSDLKKEFVYGSGDYTSINPALYEHGEINSLIFSGLTAHDKDNKIIASLAKDWTFDKNTNSYTFNLRDDVKWHDGKAFTANDVKFTLETIVNPENASEIASNYEDITNIDIINDSTIKITLKTPNVAMLDYLTIGILPKHLLYDKDIITDSFNQNPIGTGPFRMKSWDKGQSITLVKNEYYYGNEPDIDSVIFKIVTDTKARAMQLKSGELDMAQITPHDAEQFSNDENFIVNIMRTADYRGILYNFNSNIFKENKLLPNALSYAIDRQSIIDTVLLGHGEKAFSPLQAGAYVNNDIEKFEYNKEKSKQELEKLGWKVNSNGIYEKDGTKLRFTINCSEGDQVRIDMANICAQQFKEIGIDVNVSINPNIDWANQDAYLIGWGSPFDPDDHTYKVFGTDKGSNFSDYSNPKIDELLQMARETDIDSDRLNYYKEFQSELTKYMPYTFISYVDAIYVSKNNIKGITKDTILGHHGVGVFWNIDDWTISY